MLQESSFSHNMDGIKTLPPLTGRGVKSPFLHVQYHKQQPCTGPYSDIVKGMTIALVIACLGLLFGQEKLLFCLFFIKMN